MPMTTQIRQGEETVETPEAFDERVWYIGRIATPWTSRSECPRRGDLSGPVCRIRLDAPWRKALAGVKAGDRLQILYWMHEARRDLVVQAPRHSGSTAGTFSIRSPNRPNPIASSTVVVAAVHDDGLEVRGLDCLDGTPLIDIKPEACPHDSALPATGA